MVTKNSMVTDWHPWCRAALQQIRSRQDRSWFRRRISRPTTSANPALETRGRTTGVPTDYKIQHSKSQSPDIYMRKCNVITTIIMPKMLSHCTSTPQITEKSESRTRKWEEMWFKTRAENGERGQQWRVTEDCSTDEQNRKCSVADSGQTSMSNSRCQNLVPDKSGPRFAWHMHQKLAPEKCSRFMATVSGACVMGISLNDLYYML